MAQDPAPTIIRSSRTTPPGEQHTPLASDHGWPHACGSAAYSDSPSCARSNEENALSSASLLNASMHNLCAADGMFIHTEEPKHTAKSPQTTPNTGTCKSAPRRVRIVRRTPAASQTPPISSPHTPQTPQRQSPFVSTSLDRHGALCPAASVRTAVLRYNAARLSPCFAPHRSPTAR